MKPVVMVGDRRRALGDGERLDASSLPPQLPTFGIPFNWPWTAGPGTVWPGIVFAELDGGSFDYDTYPDFGALLGGTPGSTVTRPDWRDLTPWGAGGGTVGAIVGSNTLDLRHVHAAGSMQAAAHSHSAGSLTGPGHSHGAGSLASQAHSHAAGTLASDSAGSHNHGGSTGSVSQVAIGLLGVFAQATPTHSHTISGDGAHVHSVSGSTGSAGGAAVTGSTDTGGASAVTGSTASAGPHAISGDTAAASWTDLATPDAVSKLPKRALVRWFVRVSV